MKRRTVFLLILCLALTLTVPASADSSFVFDGAGLLSEDEIGTLNEAAQTVADEYGCGVYIMTVLSCEGDVFNFAQEFFISNGLGIGDDAEGIMLLLSMAERDYAIIYHGYNSGLAYVDDEVFLDDFADNDWYSGFSDYVYACGDALAYSGYEDDPIYDYTDDYLDDYREPDHSFVKPSRFPGIFFSVLLGAIAALIVCRHYKKQLESVHPARDAHEYKVPGSFALLGHRDVYTHTTVTRVRHDRDDNNMHHGGGGSGGFSGHSGKF